ncbi:restriction endonuclease subunit S [Pseudoalteromonas sp. S201]|uniref:restriction endonuclease subunit S n=1 Tax=Pseudoalteromonas sp. S201 TaxID=579519 RepID=UPI00110CF610|nr:restriction endonuclease subunit S [Pseudoalteromonas sp. S201]TMS91580.1 restriction endonuclease subunit S [Pseudoalteromonas sp. S201]
MIPVLRFSKFKSEYLPRVIDEIAKVSSGGTPSRSKSNYWNGHIPWITTSQINFEDITAADEYITELGLKNSSAKLFPKGTILLALYGQGITRGRVSVLEIEATTNQACAAIILQSEDANTRFTFYYLQSKYEDIRNLANDGGQKNLSGGLVKSLPVVLPSEVKEQAEIADFLTSVDTKISQLTEKHRLLKDYKKGVIQQIFSQQIRFKDDDGNAFAEWKEKSFNDVFNRVTTKNKENNENVLTISAQKGLISQLEYFNKSVSAKDVTGYYLLHKGDFAYNKSYSKGYPMGAIKPLKYYEKGVVSTLYICFRPKADYCEHYFEQYFDAGMLNREIAKIAQEGARNHGLLNVSVTEFFEDIKLTVPHIDEQQKIARFLQSLDKKIDAVNEQIEQTELFKKGLLQQMFV